MKRCILLGVLAAITLGATPLQASTRWIVRVLGGQSVAQADCLVAGCTVTETLDGSIGELFLMTTPDPLNVDSELSLLNSLTGVVDVELDEVARVSDSSTAVPPALTDNTPASYYGSTVIQGYIDQPATSLIGLAATRNAFPKATGAGIVAIIDTGVDPNHPALKAVLLPGYDFTRNQSGANELLDVTLPNPPTTSGSSPQWVSGGSSGNVSQSTAAVVDQSTAAVVDGNPQYCDFGHGTMVAGIVHLVAPTAKILPLKAFAANGTGYTSNILRAIYMAISEHANVLNMSFSLASYSREVANALELATLDGTISVAAAGNNGNDALVYPAALWNVMGIASTSNSDQLSTFSNYGSSLVWIGAPGEGVITTYPFSTYAAGWGTSFSTPFVSGTAALLLNMDDLCDQYSSAQSTAHAKPLNSNVGHGRLALLQALTAWSRGQ